MSKLEELPALEELTERAKEALKSPALVYWLALAFGVIGIAAVIVYLLIARKKETKA